MLPRRRKSLETLSGQGKFRSDNFPEFGLWNISFRDQRHDRFLHLAAEFALIAEKKIFHQLLGKRIAALNQPRYEG